MNDAEQIMQGIMDAVKYGIDNANIPCTQIRSALIKTVNVDRTYDVIMDTQEYPRVSAMNIDIYNYCGYPYAVNNTVRVVIPNGQMNNMFILGK